MYIILFILYYNNDIIYNNKIKPQRNELRHIKLNRVNIFEKYRAMIQSQPRSINSKCF